MLRLCLSRPRDGFDVAAVFHRLLVGQKLATNPGQAHSKMPTQSPSKFTANNYYYLSTGGQKYVNARAVFATGEVRRMAQEMNKK